MAFLRRYVNSVDCMKIHLPDVVIKLYCMTVLQVVYSTKI